MTFKINPKLDLKSLTKTLEKDGFVCIQNFLNPQSAEALLALANKCSYFKFKYNDGEEDIFVRPMDLGKMTEAELQAMGNKIFNAAMAGKHQFTYYACPLTDAAFSKNQQLEAFKVIPDFFNGPEFGKFTETLFGQSFGRAELEIQWHKPDSFQTTGDGMKKGEGRLFGFSLELTKDWNPDAGGIRFFHNKEKEIIGCIPPEFNALTIYKVPFRNSMSYISGYGKGVKLALAGWGLKK